MTATQFRNTLDKLGLSQLAAARLLQVDGRTARRWVSGERSIPSDVAILLRLLTTKKITVEDIEAAHDK